MRVLWFCIPAHGHTNPTIEVVRELTRRGHEVRYYSFEEFRERIEDAGAQLVACDSFLPPIDEKVEKRLRRVSTTEMSVQSFRTVANLDPVVSEDVASWRPDVVVTDSACFNREIRKLRPLGYHVKSALDIVSNKPEDNTIVYTSRTFQPCSETFDEGHYRFVGPSVRDVGTVINDRPGFYRTLIDALGGSDVDLLVSCGRAFDPAQLGMLPDNVCVEQHVDQMEVLSRASLFVTHCGMNSASEGMWMGVPELLFPLTGEQRAVAKRVAEVGAGTMLKEEAARNGAALRHAVLAALEDERLIEGSARMRDDLRSCVGPAGAADFIEQVARRHVGA